MKSLLLVLGLCLVPESLGKVLELGDADFDSTLEKIDNALVMFYAPWCGHCKQLKPKYDEASVPLAENDPPVILAKVDCTEAGKDVCSRFSVSGYPTLKIFKNGEVASDYNGPRDTQGIIKYMEGQVGPASKEYKSHTDILAYAEKKKAAIVACYSEDAKVQEVFEKVSQKFRETYQFAHTNKKSGEFKGIVIHRAPHMASKLEETNVAYTGDADSAALSEWIVKNVHGLAGLRTPENEKDFKEPLVVVYYDIDYEKNPKGTNYWRNRVMKVAKEFTSDFTFCVSNKEDFMQDMDKLGVMDPTKKTPLATLRADGKKYKMEEEFSVDTFRAFLESAKAGKLEPFIKSGPLPDNSDKDVKEAVAKNYDELVGNEKTKDILIEFYAPWCGHCKNLAPIYDEVAADLKDEDVMLVKMDVTANDIPPKFEVRGFPTLFWIPAGGEHESYKGGREKKDFIEFIAKKATKELKKYDRSGNLKKTEL